MSIHLIYVLASVTQNLCMESQQNIVDFQRNLLCKWLLIYISITQHTICFCFYIYLLREYQVVWLWFEHSNTKTKNKKRNWKEKRYSWEIDWCERRIEISKFVEWYDKTFVAYYNSFGWNKYTQRVSKQIDFWLTC